MAQYVGAMSAADMPDTSSGSFLSAVLSVRRGDYGVAKGLLLMMMPRTKDGNRWGLSGVADLHQRHSAVY